jgi:hypothetical protein
VAKIVSWWFLERSSNHAVESFNLSVCHYSCRSVIGLFACLVGWWVRSFVGWLIVWCAACLFGWLCLLVGRSLGRGIVWTIGQLVPCWTVGWVVRWVKLSVHQSVVWWVDGLGVGLVGCLVVRIVS